jgi:hypothetical protein
LGQKFVGFYLEIQVLEDINCHEIFHCSILENVLLKPVHTLWIKGKSTPLQALTVSEGSRRLRLADFMKIGI